MRSCQRWTREPYAGGSLLLSLMDWCFSIAADDVVGGPASRAEYHVGVTSQLLHDLLCLQVPDVRLIVLRAGHDPLEGRETKNSRLVVSEWSVG